MQYPVLEGEGFGYGQRAVAAQSSTVASFLRGRTTSASQSSSGRRMADEFHQLRSSDSPELSVGVLAADLLHLGRNLDRLQGAGVRVIHFDLMDGRFCPELTTGPWFVAARTTLVKDVHLLVTDPENWVEQCVSARAGIITVHVEASTHVHRALEVVTEAAHAQGSSRVWREYP